MSRTPEQVAADKALTTAIDNAHLAYYGPTPDVMVTYAVISKHASFDPGESYPVGHYVAMLARDNDMALCDQLGLVEYASTRIRAAILGAPDA